MQVDDNLIVHAYIGRLGADSAYKCGFKCQVQHQQLGQ